MQIELLKRPAQTVARVKLEAGESICAESGAMLAMEAHLEAKTSLGHGKKKGFFQAAKRIFMGESFFVNTFTASSQPGVIYLAPSLPGDILVCEMDGSKSLIVQGTSFLASSPTIEHNLRWEGFRGFFSGEGIFWIEMKGEGIALLSSFGCIYEREVKGEYIVDTGHVVAFESTLSYSVQKAAKGWLSSFLSGEFLVCRFRGEGKLFCQSHSPPRFGWSLNPFLRPR